MATPLFHPLLPLLRTLVCLLVAASVAAACGGANGTTSASATAPSPTAAGPTSWAAWIEHQGFGGGTGINEVRRRASWIADHDGREELFYLDRDIALVTRLIGWLDAHPPTDCWAGHHAQIRAGLVAVLEGWTAARPTVEVGGIIPAELVASVSEAAQAADGLQAPVACP